MPVFLGLRQGKNHIMKKKVIGILAHVDAGKTTLIEQLLVATGRRSEAGRVDHGTAYLDTDMQEKARGITIKSKMCRIGTEKLSLILMDTPGHVDFMAESERVLPVLDAAILVIGAGERIPAHARYLFHLLKERSIPTIIFFNKMDLPVPGKDELMAKLQECMGEGFLEWEKLPTSCSDPLDPSTAEELAVLDDKLMERFFGGNEITLSDAGNLFQRGRLFPCCFGSALHGMGIPELLTCINTICHDRHEGSSEAAGSHDQDTAEMPDAFGAYCYKILHDENGQKLTFLKVMNGKLQVRDVISYFGVDEKERSEKITQIRLYDGASFQAVQSAGTGEIVAVTGLTMTYAGLGIGIMPSHRPESSRPMLRYTLLLPDEINAREFLPKMRLLEEEEDTLSVQWIEERESIEVELYGEVQLEVLTEQIRERFGLSVAFDVGHVVYRETIEEPAYGMGHFEPLRHYAEVHLLMEPLPRGTGIMLESRLSTDELDRNWQQTILNALEQEQLTGILTNSPLTDIRISLVAGRSHKKHTEGGDFREASLRAVRQGLMEARSVLLEPYVRFSLTVPQDAAGKALYDMNQLSSESRITEQTESQTTIEGRGAVSLLRNYTSEVRTYSHGEGIFRMIYDGYDRCPDQEKAVSEIGYLPEADQLRPAGSVFVSHGTAEYVQWTDAPERMHLESRFKQFYPDPEEEQNANDTGGGSGKRPGLQERLEAIGTDEIDSILQKASHANQTRENSRERRNRWNTAVRRKDTGAAEDRNKKESQKKGTVRVPYLLVDGYNIIHAWDETREIVTQNLDAARQILLEQLTDYRAMTDAEIIVVFDAYRVHGHRTETEEYQNLHVVFTREAETADQYIARFATEHIKQYDITVATSDGLIQLIIRGADAKLMSARDLHDEVQRKREMLREVYLTEEKPAD